MPKKKDPLKTYRTRRKELKKTPEPYGTVKKSKTKKPIFVIQKHDATSLHYDVRLEIDGVLKSWAVPKGPSLDPSQKRLALPTDDHPMEYADFEGIIPESQYGAGPVMIWDKGTYTNIKKKDGKLISMSQCFKQGQIEVKLNGKKIKGDIALVRMNRPGKEQWLFIKMKDKYADARRKPTSTENKSVVSGKTMKQIEKTGAVYGQD